MHFYVHTGTLFPLQLVHHHTPLQVHLTCSPQRVHDYTPYRCTQVMSPNSSPTGTALITTCRCTPTHPQQVQPASALLFTRQEAHPHCRCAAAGG